MKRLRNAAIVLVTLVVASTAIAFGGPMVQGVLNSSASAPAKVANNAQAAQSAAPAPAPANQTGGFQAIPEGTFAPATRTAIIVREVDFRGSNPVAFFRAQFVEVGQSLVFGKDAVVQGANRDGWTFGDENIDQASKTAVELAKADARGNIPNVTVWLQLECPSEQVKLAQDRGIEVQNFGNMPFIKITASNAEKVNDAFAKVCPTGQTPAPAPQAPTAPAPAPAQSQAATTVLAFEARENVEIFPIGWIVEEVVNNLSRKITIEAKNVATPSRARIEGATHFNYWTGYGTKEAAEIGACSQFAERLNESQIQRSWNSGYQVTLLSAQCKPGPRQVPQAPPPPAPTQPPFQGGK